MIPPTAQLLQLIILNYLMMFPLPLQILLQTCLHQTFQALFTFAIPLVAYDALGPIQPNTVLLVTMSVAVPVHSSMGKHILRLANQPV
jgi:hypothetical protein